MGSDQALSEGHEEVPHLSSSSKGIVADFDRSGILAFELDDLVGFSEIDFDFDESEELVVLLVVHGHVSGGKAGHVDVIGEPVKVELPDLVGNVLPVPVRSAFVQNHRPQTRPF